MSTPIYTKTMREIEMDGEQIGRSKSGFLGHCPYVPQTEEAKVWVRGYLDGWRSRVKDPLVSHAKDSL